MSLRTETYMTRLFPQNLFLFYGKGSIDFVTLSGSVIVYSLAKLAEVTYLQIRKIESKRNHEIFDHGGTVCLA